jgi:uncharacterized protein (TIGR03437 family)
MHRARNHSATFCAFLFLFCLAASAQTFVRAPAPGGSPSPRYDAPIVHDVPGNRLLIFGGQDSIARNDVWAYSLDSRIWTELTPSGTKPAPRFGQTAIFDPVRRRMIVFAGQSGSFFSDTWAYDVAANAWQLLSPENAGPSRRYGHSAIYDPVRDRMIISHGFTDAGRFDDTWAFNLASNTWQNISPPSGRPLKRCLHHAAYDPKNNQMLLYGGCSSGFGPCPQGDLWSFDLAGQQWTERTASPRPPERQWYGAAMDTARNRLVLFGGSGSAGALGDTWEYDTIASSWTQVMPGGESPSSRYRHNGIFIDTMNAAYFFGGLTASGATSDLWLLAAAPRVNDNGVVNAASYSPAGLAPGSIASVFGTNLALDTATAGVRPLPTTLASATLRFSGVTAPQFYASPTQVNIQIPWELAGMAQPALTITTAGVAGNTQSINMATYGPGIFVAVDAQFRVVGPPNPTRAGAVIQIYATGLGPVSNPPATGAAALSSPLSTTSTIPMVTIGGLPAKVSFSGLAPDFVGLYQINAEVPAVAGNSVPVTVSLGGVASNTIAIAVASN